MQKNRFKMEAKVYCGRILLQLIIYCNLASLIIFYTYNQIALDDHGRKAFMEPTYIVNGWCFFALFWILLVAIIALMCKLRALIKTTNQDSSVFSREKNVLIITLMAFSIGYLARWVWDSFLFDDSGSWHIFSYYMAQ